MRNKYKYSHHYRINNDRHKFRQQNIKRSKEWKSNKFKQA